MAARYDEQYLIQLKGVNKRYNSFTAVNNVSLDICPGEIFAMLGPNGAGKTTLIGCVTGLVADFEGEITVAGFDVRKDYRITRRLIGLVPQELNYDAFFTVRQALEFQGTYYGQRPPKGRVDELLSAFSLQDKADANSRWLSGGMKRRLMICKALMHNPVMLFLDEPTAGVDVNLRDELWTYVENLRAMGTTIVLTTHYIEEAQQLADRIGIMNRGRLVRVDTRENLMQQFGQRHVDVKLDRDITKDLLAKLEGLDVRAHADRVLRLVFHERPGEKIVGDETPLERLLRAILAEESFRIESIEGGRRSLEEIFRELIDTDSETLAGRGAK